MKKALSMCAAVALILLSVSPLTTKAEDFEPRSFYETVGELGLAERVLADGEKYYYVSGTGPLTVDKVTSTVQYEAVYIASGDSFVCHSNLWYSDGTVKWSTTTRNAPQIATDRINAQVTYFYDSTRSGVVTLTAFYSNDKTAVQNVEINSSDCTNVVTTVYHPASAGATLGSIATEIAGGDQDATEPTGGFQLPDSWINGGETLAPAEPMTFESVDLDDAMQELESMEYTTPPDVLGAVGAFWYIFDGFVDASGLQWLVITSLVVVLVAWFLGRRV